MTEQERNRAVDKHEVLRVITETPGLYADEVAEKLVMPTGLAVELVGELIDEGILECAR